MIHRYTRVRQLEAELPEEMRLVRALLVDAGLPPEAWTAIPGVRGLLEAVAVHRRAQRLQQDQQLETPAFDQAAVHFGIRLKTLRRRLSRWWIEAQKWTGDSMSPGPFLDSRERTESGKP